MENNKNNEKLGTLIHVYGTHGRAEEAVQELKRGGFDMKKLSILAKDFQSQENVVGFYNAGDRMKSWGKFGAIWGGLWGMLFGSGIFLVPVIVAGSFAALLVATLEGAVVMGGFTAIGAALFSIGIPKDTVLRYETDLKAGKFLLVAHGAHEEVERAKEILASHSIKSELHSVAS
jgi:hypothetical protein